MCNLLSRLFIHLLERPDGLSNHLLTLLVFAGVYLVTKRVQYNVNSVLKKDI